MIRTARSAPTLDVVVPCYNEQEVLGTTYRSLAEVLGGLESRGEIAGWRLILVDNGSSDSTLEVMLGLFNADPHVAVIELRRNFGFQGSLSAGLRHASADAVVSIDADLQDPPELIGQMVAHYREGYDLVLGVRINRKESDPPLVRFLAACYYGLAKFLRTPTVPQHGDFRLVGRELLEVINAMPERNRFLRTMIPQLESRYATVPYSRRKRRLGRSKHGVMTALSIALDGVAGFGYQPLRTLFPLSVFLFLAAIAAFIAEAVVRSGPGESHSHGLLIGVMLLLSSINLGALALAGEYLGRVFVEARGRPPFLVRRTHMRANLGGVS